MSNERSWRRVPKPPEKALYEIRGKQVRIEINDSQSDDDFWHYDVDILHDGWQYCGYLNYDVTSEVTDSEIRRDLNDIVRRFMRENLTNISEGAEKVFDGHKVRFYSDSYISDDYGLPMYSVVLYDDAIGDEDDGWVEDFSFGVSSAMSMSEIEEAVANELREFYAYRQSLGKMAKSNISFNDRVKSIRYKM